MNQIVLVPYQAEWERSFQTEKNRILKAAGDFIHSIEHVGSTAVPGLSAKPIVDVMVGLKDFERDKDAYVVAMEDAGYTYEPKYNLQLPFRRYLKKYSKEKKTHHIHSVDFRHPWWERHLLFRNYLKAFPDVRDEYEALKQKLCLAYNKGEILDYTEGKTRFIRGIEKKALKHFRKRRMR
ncbi:MAG: GrpB family protein [Bacteroidota bacterium]